jgi:glycosyltransferase involved in cell wall biosynthesis
VAARVGGIPEALHRPELGVLVEPDSGDSLADGIESLLIDPKWAACIAENAQNEANRRYSVDAMLDQIEAVYARVTGPHGELGAQFAR